MRLNRGNRTSDRNRVGAREGMLVGRMHSASDRNRNRVGAGVERSGAGPLVGARSGGQETGRASTGGHSTPCHQTGRGRVISDT